MARAAHQTLERPTCAGPRRAGADSCGWCAHPIPAHREHLAVLADSSVIHPSDPALDGRRVVLACSGEHLARLRASTPAWNDAQFWAGRLARAHRAGHHARRRRPLPLVALAKRAGLTPDQARRAAAWLHAHPELLNRA